MVRKKRATWGQKGSKKFHYTVGTVPPPVQPAFGIAINQQHCHIMSGYEMEMEHVRYGRANQPSEFIFPPSKATPKKRAGIKLRSCRARNQNRHGRNKPEATGCCPLGGGGGAGAGGMGQSGVVPLLCVQMRPWKGGRVYQPTPVHTAPSAHQVVAGAFVRFSPAAFPRERERARGLQNFLRGPGDDCRFQPNPIKLCAGMRHGTSWQTACLLIGKVWSLLCFAYLHIIYEYISISNSSTRQTLHPNL